MHIRQTGDGFKPSDDLAALAQQINAEHDALTTAYGVALDHARGAGTLLIDAKAGVSHGAWGEWVITNCRFSARTARVYAQIAREWPKIDAKRQSIADLTLARAIEIVSPPKQPKPATTPPRSPVIIEAAAREVQPDERRERAAGFGASQFRREPTPDERAHDERVAEVARFIIGHLQDRPRHLKDITVPLVCDALVRASDMFNNGDVELGQ